MDTIQWIAIASLIVAALAIPSAIWATRQWGTRRARLECSAHSSPLLPKPGREGLLQVTYRDFPVTDPHIVSFALRNVGPRDIASSFFDSGSSIKITLQGTFYGLTEVDGARLDMPALGTTDAVVMIRPLLIKRGESCSFSAIVSGPSDVKLELPLIDTDIVMRNAEDPSPGRRLVVRVPGVSLEIPLKQR